MPACPTAGHCPCTCRWRCIQRLLRVAARYRSAWSISVTKRRCASQSGARGGGAPPARLCPLVTTTDLRPPQSEPGDPGELGEAGEGGAEAIEPDDLSAVEQEDLPQEGSLVDLLAQIGWPPQVQGAAIAVERIVLPPSAQADLPQDDEAALAAVAEHPGREDVRILVAVLRDGSSTCLLRQRSNDSDDRVAVGQDIAPGLVEALAETLRD